MENEQTHFGEHLMLDGYGGSYEKLNSKDLVSSILYDLPTKLGMKLLSEPVVYFAEPNHIKDPGGWSGVVVIAESHLSIHTFPEKGFVTADVYTCKNGMDNEYIIKYLTDAFELKETEINFVKRGLRYMSYQNK
ncbi:MAG: adenosylmethionine decarboxylase [Minisyncoccia bacterium]